MRPQYPPAGLTTLVPGDAGPASVVFARAGKSEVNALIERLYGRPAATAGGRAQRVLALLEGVSDESVEAVVQLLEAWPRAPREAAPVQKRRQK